MPLSLTWSLRGTIACGVLMLLGCVVIGDGALSVRGTIADPDGRRFASCRVSILLEGYGLFDTRDVAEAEFLVTFVVEPKRRRYRFSVGCRDALTVFESAVVEGGDLATSHNPIDLGRIVLARIP